MCSSSSCFARLHLLLQWLSSAVVFNKHRGKRGARIRHDLGEVADRSQKTNRIVGHIIVLESYLSIRNGFAVIPVDRSSMGAGRLSRTPCASFMQPTYPMLLVVIDSPIAAVNPC